MAIQKTEAFILRNQPFRSSSLLVTAFSRSFGKIKGVAKGVRGEGVLRSADFEPFNHVELIFYEKIHSDLHLISEITTLKTYEALRGDLEVLAHAYYFSELVDQLTEPHDTHPAVFDLLSFAWEWLPSIHPSRLARFFEIRLLGEVGFLPQLEHCLGCEAREFENIYFSARQGAIFCSRCRTKIQEARPLSGEALAVMRRFLAAEGNQIFEQSISETVNREIEQLAERFLMERLGKRLWARRFIRQVNSLKRPASVGKAENDQNDNQ